jgi:uncharacterized protein (TIGR02594 family)
VAISDLQAATVPAILTVQEADKAGRYNQKRGRRVGWTAHWSGVCRILGISNGALSREDFSQYVAQFQKARKLKDDGMLGPDTWRRMSGEARVALKVLPLPNWLPQAAPKKSPIRAVSVEPLNFEAPWMAIALSEQASNWMNDDEHAIVEGDTRVDEGYFEACPYMGGEAWKLSDRQKLKINNRHWCAAFVNYCLHRAGYSHTGSAGAFSFKQTRRWRFEALSEPRRGCVIVMEHNRDGFDHVAFLDKVGDLPSNPRGDIDASDYSGFTLLGGNQGGDSVNSKRFVNWTFFATRDSFGNKSPYLYPIRAEGEANCNVELPTAGPHYCGEQWK